MKNKWRRSLAEVIAVTVVILVLTSSYLLRNEGGVLGAFTSNKDGVDQNGQQTRITTEITRLEGLLEQYPTYPPLLQQLAKLNRLAGHEEQAAQYEKELVRLGAN